VEVKEIEKIYGEYFPNKCFTKSGEAQARKMITAYGLSVVAEALRHLSTKFDATDVWGKWLNACKSYQKYGRHIPDNVWFMYYRLSKKIGAQSAIQVVDFIMEERIENEPGLTQYIAHESRNFFEKSGGSVWMAIESFTNIEA
jgi:hypothetical protein